MHSTWSEAALLSVTLVFDRVSSPVASNDLFSGDDIGRFDGIAANSAWP